MIMGLLYTIESIFWVLFALFGVYHYIKGNPINSDVVLIVFSIGLLTHTLILSSIIKRLKGIDNNLEKINNKLGL